MLTGKILITGGAGTLGTAIVERATRENWDCDITVFSRDWEKHRKMRYFFPNVNYVVGDILSRDMLNLACAGMDIVIHAAAMKHVVEGEKYPLSVFDVNVGGSMNVAEACVEQNVPHVIAISTDKACLNWHEPIHFRDGRKLPIGKVVRDKVQGEILSCDENGALVWKPITNWYKNKLSNRKMYSVSYNGTYMHQGRKTDVKVTEDHLIKVFDKQERREKWVQAQYIDSKSHLIVTGEWSPSLPQKAVLLGAIIGDGNLPKISGNGRSSLRLGHSKKQLEWLYLKKGALEDMGWGNIKVAKKNTKYEFYSFRSAASAYLSEKRKQHYEEDGTRILPRADIYSVLYFGYTRMMFMTTLYLDDGTISDNLARIATHSYSKEDVEWLIDRFNEFGYECYLYNPKMGESVYNEIRFTRPGSDKFYEDIALYVPPTMQYKLPEGVRGRFEKAKWFMHPGLRYLSEPVVEEISAPKRDVYCLDIEDTHNFVVNNVIVHNCHPANAYGCSKMMMERVFQRYAQCYEHVNFHLVRYGNVIGSTGSFVPVWRRQIEEGNYITITHPDMTRFWLKVEDAMDLILEGLEWPSGSTLIPIPKNARMGDIADAIVPSDIERKIVGIRPGEKMNECLLTDEEGARSDFVYDSMDTSKQWIRLYYATMKPFDTGPIPVYSSDEERMLDAEGIKEMFGEL